MFQINSKVSGRFTELQTVLNQYRINKQVCLETLGTCLHDLAPVERYAALSRRDVSKKDSIIHLVALRGDNDLMKLLLQFISPDSRADLLAIVDHAQYTVAMYAAQNEHTEMIRCMLDGMSSDQIYNLLKMQCRLTGTAIHQAAVVGHTETIKCMLGSVSPDQLYNLLELEDYAGRTAIHQAAVFGHTETIKCMLGSVSPDQSYNLLELEDYAGRTAIHKAAEEGHAETIKCMLDSISPDQLYNLLKMQDLFSCTALHRAAMMSNAEAIKRMLYSMSSDQIYNLLEMRDSAGFTAIHKAAGERDAETVKHMLDNISMNQVYKLLKIRKVENGDCLLHVAAESGHQLIMDCFIRKLSVEKLYELLALQNSNGKSVLEVATATILLLIARHISAENAFQLFRTEDSQESTVERLIPLMSEANTHVETVIKVNQKQNHSELMILLQKYKEMHGDYCRMTLQQGNIILFLTV